MKTTMAKSVLLALLTASMLGNSAAQALYRWVDKNGKVQYSDMPPPSDVKNSQQKRLGDNLIEQDTLSYALKIAVQNNPVTLYANNCGSGCDQARALLNKRGIPFVDRDPQKDEEAAKALVALVGALDVPTITIGSTKLSGFTEDAWNSALDSARYPRNSPPPRSPATAPKAAPTDKPASEAASPAPN